MTERYIPAGRTSRVKTSSGLLQLQTEYAYHPYPRITTTIQSSGQVLHKVEKRLENEICTIEEQQLMENIMKRQHTEVEEIVCRQPVPPQPQQPETSPTPEIVLKSKTQEPDQPSKSIRELLRELPGVEHVFRLDNSGVFHSDAVSEQFRKSFGPVFKGLNELLLLFDELPGPGPRRRRGIYEVQRDRLYLISAGDECLFITIKRIDRDTDYEKALKEIAFGKWGPDFAHQDMTN